MHHAFLFPYKNYNVGELDEIESVSVGHSLCNFVARKKEILNFYASRCNITRSEPRHVKLLCIFRFKKERTSKRKDYRTASVEKENNFSYSS